MTTENGTFLCECANDDCKETIHLRLAEVLELRKAYPPHNGYTIVRPGHEYGEPVMCAGVAIAGDHYRVVFASRP